MMGTSATCIAHGGLNLGVFIIVVVDKNCKIGSIAAQYIDPVSRREPEFSVSLKSLQEVLLQSQPYRKGLLDLGTSIIERIETDSALPRTYLVQDKFDVKINFQAIDITQILKSFQRNGHTSALPRKIYTRFSPNIAKPFHVGHLRSTILGNFIANLHAAFGHQVTRINYLGDWGTQFGLLKYGYDSKNMKENNLEDNAIKKLYDVYVWANERAAEDPNIYNIAREIFSEIEKGNRQELETWKLFRRVSIEDLKKIYFRLNVRFDEFHGESMYNATICNEVVKEMEEKGLLQLMDDGRKVYQVNAKQKVTIVKSDGSSIYLTRDVAGAVDRYKRYGFTKMYYVVDNSQTDHFHALFDILKRLGKDWAKSLEHIKFGRILGMSTRKGNVVFLQDLLNEAQGIMKENQLNTNTTKETEKCSSETADIVAVSAVLIADMKQRRQKDYVFSWNKALQSRGDTGVKMQYVHCRLVSLEENCGMQYVDQVDLSYLSEAEAQNVIREIARFDEVLMETYKELEPCVLVNYLLKFCGIVNGAFKTLKVKSSPAEVAEARLALFIAARHTLAAGMKILGLRPLRKM
ncbi:probable arginine--tRNA ligase, mitochondrial [Penaeus japonicus]|uniref:probable arginine--tRNA ligase, mitochondrial n=1 Tax=Penaeus japonicus TaxID=27405 RepID=UPI001C70F61B|nr:probable arginine--tRNA ligase, mitochondrial [Penaeus japonicus]